jgi:hypothetical protein
MTTSLGRCLTLVDLAEEYKLVQLGRIFREDVVMWRKRAARASEAELVLVV